VIFEIKIQPQEGFTPALYLLPFDLTAPPNSLIVLL